jgi:hypothetical protein
MLAGSFDPLLSSGGRNTCHGTSFALVEKHPSQHARPKDPCYTVFVTKGKKMRTSKKTTQKQPRFMLRVHMGQLSYTCRGCNHQCHHVAHMMKHLQGCQAL